MIAAHMSGLTLYKKYVSTEDNNARIVSMVLRSVISSRSSICGDGDGSDVSSRQARDAQFSAQPAHHFDRKALSPGLHLYGEVNSASTLIFCGGGNKTSAKSISK